ncbi:Cupin domain-containing protein [Arcticibacter pallidicorallinus]|uniref:Cupin domain-containing protein n=1 Tax=Arcticibacter pallidicorallinus TaxID=1259464 RepID=A0A2T0UCB5_9SPHI|nr:cupin domain-containing protein [Arcticibacter pallidicorallinus]PRY55508.1 Cupin domain-containing protein [Arcticibacter pallidicorallinus]
MKYSFDNLDYSYGKAHNGMNPIYFSRVATLSSHFAFNFLDFVKVPVSSGIGKHTHSADNQEIYIIISGQAEMIVEGKAYSVKEGDVIVNPIGGTHQLLNTGSEDVHLIVLETPISKGGTNAG